jgi:secreted PhoX family phosphatase
MVVPRRPPRRFAEEREGVAVSRPVSRRAVLGATVATGLGVAVAGTLGTLFNGSEPANRAPRGGGGAASPKTAGYGALVSDPEKRLALPEGFRYRLLAEQGRTRLESGEFSPSDPDGAAAFASPSGSGTVLVCNHEIGRREPFPVPHLDGLVYDTAGRGGTTTMELAADGSLIRQYVSLAGTVGNCAGGRTPWDTWLSCEETEAVLDQPHGYVFEVDPFDQEANRNPRPIKALGRFPHEAVVVDPDEHVLYLTEDGKEPNGLLYRYTPPPEALPLGKGSLRQLADDAGTLEALRATTMDGRHVLDLAAITAIDTTLVVHWVTVPDRDATTEPVRRQFADGKITRGRKLEGMWWGDGGAYVVSSYARADKGDPATHDGQVWFLDPRAGTLRLHLRFAATADKNVDPDGPDNITVSPYGGVVIAEDGEGRPHLLGATPGGEVFYLARSEGEGSEFCGPVFSADKQTLFLNLQGPGLTFAIQGPFVDVT